MLQEYIEGEEQIHFLYPRCRFVLLISRILFSCRIHLPQAFVLFIPRCLLSSNFFGDLIVYYIIELLCMFSILNIVCYLQALYETQCVFYCTSENGQKHLAHLIFLAFAGGLRGGSINCFATCASSPAVVAEMVMGYTYNPILKQYDLQKRLTFQFQLKPLEGVDLV